MAVNWIFVTVSLALLIAAMSQGCERPGAGAATPSAAGAASPAVAKTPGAATPATSQAATTVERSDEEWRKILTPQQYNVLRQKGTERAFTGEYDHTFDPGTYACAACGNELFESTTKFDSGCGWPAFYAAKAGDKVILTPDHSHGMTRVEVTCARCKSHLGHVFDDAPDKPTGQRFCINSVSLKFIPAKATTKPAQK
jgi:peptide-methionine (R)-S-oxide reductase